MSKYEHETIEGKLGNEIYVKDPEGKGYTAFFSEFPQIVAEGETIEDAQENLWNSLSILLTNFLKRR